MVLKSVLSISREISCDYFYGWRYTGGKNKMSGYRY